jgi:alcohol dehydrogenase class IV
MIQDPEDPSAPAEFGWGGTEVAVGPGARAHLATLVPEGPVVLVRGGSARRDPTLAEDILAKLPEGTVIHEGVRPNPSAEGVEALVAKLQESRATTIVAAGGGSVLDTAKAARAALARDGDLAAALVDPPGSRDGLPRLICLPTTCGTGSEVTPVATVWDLETPRKRSLDCDAVQPDHALVDPELARGMPPELVRQSAGDALTHASESIWSKRNTPISDAAAVQAIRNIRGGLEAWEGDPEGLDPFVELAWGSLLAGMAISVTRTAAAHALSYLLTMRFGLAHGSAVMALMPGVLEVNLAGLEEGRRSLLRDAWEVATDDELVPAVRAFSEAHELARPLREDGVSEEHLDDLVAAADIPERLGNNLVDLDEATLRKVLEGAL